MESKLQKNEIEEEQKILVDKSTYKIPNRSHISKHHKSKDLSCDHQDDKLNPHNKNITNIQNSIIKENPFYENSSINSISIELEKSRFNKETFSDYEFRNNDDSSFRKNISAKKFNVNNEELYEQFFEYYFTKIFNFNNFSEHEDDYEFDDDIDQSSEKQSQFNEHTIANQNKTISKKIDDLNSYEFLIKLQLDSIEKINIFKETYKNLIFLLNCSFKYIGEDKIIELLNILLKKQKNIHVFQVLNTFYLFNCIQRYISYYNNLISSQMYKSREFLNENINEFFTIDYNRNFLNIFKYHKITYLDEELDEFTNINEISKNKRELRLDRNCKLYRIFFNSSLY